MRFSVAAAFVAISFIWGSTYLFIKVGLQYWPPLLLASLRNLVAFAAIAVLVLYMGRSLPRRWKEWRHLAIFAILNGSAFALIFWAERYIPSGRTAVLVAAMPFFNLPLARWWTREKTYSIQYVAVILGFVGVVLSAGQQTGHGFSGDFQMRMIAQLAVLGAAFCYALSYAYNKRYIQGDTYVDTMIHLGVSGLYLLVLSLLFDPSADIDKAMNWNGLGSLLYLALIGSALAYWLMFFLIANLDSVTASYSTLINPVVAVILGIVFLHETITLTTALGVVSVVFGAWLINRPKKPNVRSYRGQETVTERAK